MYNVGYLRTHMSYQKYFFLMIKIRIFIQNYLFYLKFHHVKLLVVDDNPINQKLLLYSLKKEFDIELANNGLEAVNILADNSFDVVLMDLMMPVMDGAEATLRIRESDRHRNKYIPIILLTTNDLENDRLRCMESGADDYLIKPVNITNLIDTIDYHIKQKQEMY